MTVLGAVFAAAYLIAFVRHGRRGLLAVAICSAPFSSSAMLAFGGNGVGSFHVGLILYAGATVLSRAVSHGRKNSGDKTRSGLLLILAVVAGLGGIAGPAWFAGMPVIAPGVGLDEQVSTQTSLKYSVSGLAQFAYLALALYLVHLNQIDRYITRRLVTKAMALGVAVALAAYAFQVIGLSWPTALFDNFPGNFYAPATARLRAQFSEPSQLGAFSLVALAYFATATAIAKRPQNGWGHFTLACASALLLVASYSGTAIVGLVVTSAVGAIIGLILWVRNGARLHPYTFIALCLFMMIAIPLADDVVEFVIGAIDGKHGGVSFRNRGLANEIAFKIFEDTNWVGVGLGNNRASSLFPMLLSTIGAIGVLLFFIVVARAAVSSLPIVERLPLFLALTAYLAAAFTSLADFASPIMWMLIAACYASSSNQSTELQPEAKKGAGRLMRPAPTTPAMPPSPGSPWTTIRR